MQNNFFFEFKIFHVSSHAWSLQHKSISIHTRYSIFILRQTLLNHDFQIKFQFSPVNLHLTSGIFWWSPNPFPLKINILYNPHSIAEELRGRSQITSRFRGEGGLKNLWQSQYKVFCSLENLWQGGRGGGKKVVFCVT